MCRLSVLCLKRPYQKALTEAQVIQSINTYKHKFGPIRFTTKRIFQPSSFYNKTNNFYKTRISFTPLFPTNGVSNLNVIAFTPLINGYSKLGDINPAREIFDSLKNWDVIAWTAMIVGYEQNGLNYNAVELFKLMVKEGLSVKPNNYTFAAILSVISSTASLDCGKQIHAMSMKFGESSPVSVSNGLITMYAKSGSINDAKRVFSFINGLNKTVSWTSMILALAQHGLGEEAIDLFEKMLNRNIQPDHITYVGVFVACTHIGQVEKGKNFYYNVMQKVHQIEPTPTHYSCMVDLLGRAGLLQEAYEFISKMPIEPDNIIWGSLLSACKVHKNLELAKIAAEKLLSIDPENSGAFSVLANLYSICGKWVEKGEVRKLMKEKRVKKDQGLSWIRIKNGIHVFGATDTVHPRREVIYEKMGEIWEEIKKMGFIPDTGEVFHDLDEEVKEEILRHYSEKLAIAFGVLNTPENTTLRIMKNLRVCNDCHNAIKFVSRLVGREIIVRDATRFHHLKDGVCSCRDIGSLNIDIFAFNGDVARLWRGRDGGGGGIDEFIFPRRKQIKILPTYDRFGRNVSSSSLLNLYPNNASQLARDRFGDYGNTMILRHWHWHWHRDDPWDKKKIGIVRLIKKTSVKSTILIPFSLNC